MPVDEVVWLPVPRVVVASCKRTRAGSGESLAVLDDIPFEVPSLGEAEAREAVRAVPLVRGSTRAPEAWRLHGGALFRDLRTGGCDGSPAAVAAKLAERAALHVGTARWSETRFGDERVFPYIETFRNVSRSRGVRPLAMHPVRQVNEDGREAQAAIVAEVGRHLILVGGRLSHRAPVPLISVTSPGEGRFVSAVALTPHLDVWDAPGMRARHNPWDTFAVDRMDDARAYAEALASGYAGPGKAQVSLRDGGLVVVDAEALAMASGTEDVRTLVAACAERFAATCGPHMHAMPDDVLDAYAESRAAAATLRAGDVPDGVESAYGALDGFMVAATDFLRASGCGAEAVDAARGIRTRWEAVELPRLQGPVPSPPR